MSFSSKISKQRLHILTFQIRLLIWQLAFILLEFWEPLVITLQNLFAGLVWNDAGYVAGIRVLLEDGGLLGMGWSVAECLHWSVGVWLLEYSH
ncbi:hypothetical protein AB3S75_034603 [Citrus x aurantiifolia]